MGCGTDVTPEHDAASEAAGKAYAAFNGNPAIIQSAREFLAQKDALDDITVRQLNQILLNAAEYPMTNPALVDARVHAETQQSSILNSFQFKLHGKPISANEIDDLLASSTDLSERRSVWEASKESGKALKDNLIKLRDLRNGAAGELGFPDYFGLQVAAYGMTTGEMVRMQDDFMRVLRPLYLQLHTWTKYKLAEKYHQPVPRLIPAHWINNRWSQEWTGLVEAANIDDTPCYYYSYAVATVLKFQLHDYIARNILHQPPQACNYAGNREVGAWLKSILEKGGTEDWRRLLREKTGEDLSTRAMVEYFKPLESWLEDQNKGRQIGWD